MKLYWYLAAWASLLIAAIYLVKLYKREAINGKIEEYMGGFIVPAIFALIAGLLLGSLYLLGGYKGQLGIAGYSSAPMVSWVGGIISTLSTLASIAGLILAFSAPVAVTWFGRHSRRQAITQWILLLALSVAIFPLSRWAGIKQIDREDSSVASLYGKIVIESPIDSVYLMRSSDYQQLSISGPAGFTRRLKETFETLSERRHADFLEIGNRRIRVVLVLHGSNTDRSRIVEKAFLFDGKKLVSEKP